MFCLAVPCRQQVWGTVCPALRCPRRTRSAIDSITRPSAEACDVVHPKESWRDCINPLWGKTHLGVITSFEIGLERPLVFTAQGHLGMKVTAYFKQVHLSAGPVLKCCHIVCCNTSKRNGHRCIFPFSRCYLFHLYIYCSYCYYFIHQIVW